MEGDRELEHWAIGIDLGSARTAAAAAEWSPSSSSSSSPSSSSPSGPNDGTRTSIRLLDIAGRPNTPSIVALDADGRLVAGTAAEHLARTDPGRVERRVAELLGHPAPLLIDGTAFDARDAVAAVLRVVLDEGRLRAGGRAPATAVLTHPAGWANVRRDALRDAAARAGLDQGLDQGLDRVLDRVLVVPEPLAAAASLDVPAATGVGERRRVGGVVAVFDLGASRLDTAVVRRTDATLDDELVGVPGVDDTVSGARFDHLLFGWVVDQLAAVDPDRWGEAFAADDAAARSLAHDVRAEIVRAKEALSSYTSTTLVFGDGAELLLNRSQFEALVIDDVERAVASLVRTVEAAGVRLEELDAVVLVGGSARIPLVAQLLAEHVGADRIVLGDDPSSVVALGAAHLAGLAARTADASAAQAAGTTGAVLASPPAAALPPPGSGLPHPASPSSAPVATTALPPPLAPPPGAPVVPVEPAAVVPQANVVWRAAVPVDIGRLAADRDGVVFGDRQGGARALDGATGRVRWHVPVNAPVWAPPGLDADLVAVAGLDGRVGALDRTTGVARWWASSGAPIGAAPVVLADAVLVGDDSGAVTSFDRATGAVRWRLPLGAAIRADLVASVVAGPSGPGVIAATLGGEVFAIDPATGVCRWGYRTAGPVTTAPAVVGSTVLVPSEAGYLYALDVATGQARYGVRCAGTRLTAAATLDGAVGIVDATTLRVHRADTGQAVLEVELAAVAAAGGQPVGLVLVPATTPLAVVETGGTLVGLPVDGGATRFTLPTGRGNVTAPVRTGGVVVAGTTFGQLYGIVV